LDHYGLSFLQGGPSAEWFSGNGRPSRVIAADGLRIFEGVLAEHRDVLQMDVARVESKSGLPMLQLDFSD
jgi:hypothetical protein